ncbi:MAG: hypothetical protein HQ523_05530 [Lentisphaerae bacterium]|nr:hypothetical protein [Lentisphaerota bacterium]
MNRRIVAVVTLFLGLLFDARAELRLPAIFADDMVLQRGVACPVWGWSTPGDSVTVKFADQTKTATAAADGRWEIRLAPMSASAKAGTLDIASSIFNSQSSISNVVVGDVWICSGQSNMQFPVNNAINAQEEVAQAAHPGIRLFFMPNVTSLRPLDDCAGNWKICSPETVGGFTAVGYFFGRDLHRELGVPMGLIGTSWGGTVAEAWTSAEALHAKLPEFDVAIRENLAAEESVSNALERYQSEMVLFNEAAKSLYEIEEDLVTAGKRAAASLDDAGWGVVALPGNWEIRGMPNLDGIVWFRKTVDIPADWAGKDIVLHTGPIDEVDVTWFNGQQVGARGRSRTHEVSFWNVPRE